jgi:hypothetical protein
MKNQLESRFVQCTELRAVTQEDGKIVISGLAIPYGKQSVNLGGFKEVIEKGTFRSPVESDQDIVSTANHDPRLILGRRSNGTLQLEDRPEGVWMSATLPNTSAARDVAELISGGYMTGQSFQFRNTPGTDRFSRTADGTVLRTVTDASLIELGPVTFPAYEQTSANVSAETRSAVEALQREETRTEEPAEASAAAAGAPVEDEQKNETNRVDLLMKELDLAEIELI